MALVELSGCAVVPHLGHKGHLVLEVIGAVVKDWLPQSQNNHLQHRQCQAQILPTTFSRHREGPLWRLAWRESQNAPAGALD